MRMVIIRDATEVDLPAIVDIYNEVVATPAAIWRGGPQGVAERAARFDQKTTAGDAVLVSVDDTGVTGFAAFGPFLHARLGSSRVGLLPGVGRTFGRQVDLVLLQRTLDVDAARS